jgi:hypothetical protein
MHLILAYRQLICKDCAQPDEGAPALGLEDTGNALALRPFSGLTKKPLISGIMKSPETARMKGGLKYSLKRWLRKYTLTLGYVIIQSMGLQ